MTYQEAKRQQAAIEAAFYAANDKRQAVEERLAAEIGIAARGAMNLIAEPIRLHPEYRLAKSATDAAFASLQAFNRIYSKRFAKDIRADRDKRRAAHVI